MNAEPAAWDTGLTAGPEASPVKPVSTGARLVDRCQTCYSKLTPSLFRFIVEELKGFCFLF